ncbi:right-handed parallel beta-helix repeat-containing protein, partial [Candidatus Eisenbacteria bacterium]
MRWFVAIHAVLCFLTPSALADILLVHADGSGNYPTIQYAIAQASWGDTVQLADGRFTGSGNRDLTYNGKPITIQSQSGNAEDCIIDCQGTSEDCHRGFDFHWTESPNSVLQRVTIANGYMYTSGDITLDMLGGGIHIGENCNPTLIDVIVRDCTGPVGGGVYIHNNSSEFVGCTFKNNTAWYGHGGGVSSTNGSPSFIDCIFERNTSLQGGAGMDGYGHEALTVTGCWFRDNTEGDCPGLALVGSQTEITRTTFARNSYGALEISSCSDGVHLDECTFYGNTGYMGHDAAASVVAVGDVSILIENSIIAFGVDAPAVGCIYDATVTLSCCNLYGNNAGDWVGCIADQYGVNGNISEDPLFCAPDYDDFNLQEGSPCAPFSPPNEECDLIGAWSGACHPPQFVCCVGLECSVVTEVECDAMGGDWMNDPPQVTCAP